MRCGGRRFGIGLSLAVLVMLVTSCSPPEPPPLPRDSFAFGVFGDGPYRTSQMGRFRRLIADVNGADLEWLLHVGDILWYPCTDEAYADRLGAMNSVRHAVVYTPGDNEWTDCHEDIPGGFEPLGRLASIRRTFFGEPESSLGGRRMRLESQGADSTFSEFVENARWTFGGFVFATVHMVGSGNGSESFPGRTSAHDEEVSRRTAAALAWLDETFAIATQEELTGVVLALHGNPFDDDDPNAGVLPGYEELMARLAARVREFSGPVLLIHGDWHELRIDHPLKDPETGEPFANFTRLETYGSPDIGWVRVVVDTVAGRVVEYEPRRMSWRLFW